MNTIVHQADIPASAAPAAAPMPATSRRSIAGSFFGMVLESYDFLLYASVATVVFGPLFFPSSDPFTGVMLGAGSFAVGFIARPLGGIIFGHFGDRVGRKPLMLISLMMIGVTTVLIGCLPTYAQIGIAAPVLLVLLRLVQGIAYGGETVGAVLMSVEHAPEGRRGLVGALPFAAIPLGLLLATGVIKLATAFSGPQYMEWGWRLPFLFAAVVFALGLWVRHKTTETPAFKEATAKGTALRQPLLVVLRKYPLEVVYSTGVYSFSQCVYYTVVVFAVQYCVGTLKMPLPTMMTAIAIASGVQVFALTCAGALSDRFGRLPVMLCGAVVLALFMTQFFSLLQSTDAFTITAAIVVALVLNSAFFGPTAALFVESFDPEVRFSGISLGANFGTILGGFTPMIALALLKAYDYQTWPIVVYVVSAIGVGTLSLLLLRRTVNAKRRTFA